MPVDWLARFQRYAAVQQGHFLLTSGLHSPLYVQCALILQYPHEAAALGEALAVQVRDSRPDVVVGPALGAVLVAHEVARALGLRALFAERAHGVLALRRGFAIAPGERVLIVEDVVTTGTTTAEVAGLVRGAGGVVVAAAALIDRSAGRWPLDVPLRALARVDAPTYSPDQCPQCRSGMPLVTPGSRASGPKSEH